MVTKKFLLVLKSENGYVSTSDVLYDGSQVQSGIIGFNKSGFSVIDVVVVEVDLSKYEY